MTATDGYLFYTRPHFLDEDLYLRVVILPGLISEPSRDHGQAGTAPSASGHVACFCLPENSAIYDRRAWIRLSCDVQANY